MDNKSAHWSSRIATLAILVMLGSVASGTAAAEGSYPIAGVRPQERPQGAPTITEFKKAPGWYSRALTGVSQPFPYSLRFLEDQEAWYTPFTLPGMTGPYDIRGWHAQPPAAGPQRGLRPGT